MGRGCPAGLCSGVIVLVVDIVRAPSGCGAAVGWFWAKQRRWARPDGSRLRFPAIQDSGLRTQDLDRVPGVLFVVGFGAGAALVTAASFVGDEEVVEATANLYYV